MNNEEILEQEREEMAAEASEYVWFNKNLEAADQRLLEIDNMLREIEDGD